MGVVAQEWVRWTWVTEHTDEIRAALTEHVQLTAMAVAAGLAISIPLGIAAVRFPGLRTPILALGGIIYAVPSLALFMLVTPWTGYLTPTPVFIGLTGYTLLILTRNVITGLEGVSDDVLEAASGMGYGRARRLLLVELPLALPTIIAGVRIATVSTVALVTIGFVVGHGGLGELINDGFRNLGHNTQLVVGAGLSVLLALVADVLLLGLGWLLTPWARRR